MRIPRLFVDDPLQVGLPYSLEGQHAHYLTKVLRMSEGRPLILFNNTNVEFNAEVLSITKRTVQLRVQSASAIDRESPLHTTLAIGVSRGERMDHIIQKSVELGVSEITPLFTERTEVKLKADRLQKKLEHWRQIIVSACEQCQRNTLPVLNSPNTLNEFAPAHQAELKLVLHHRSFKKLSGYTPPKSVSLLIGPEGGLSDNEITFVEKYAFSPLTLGPRVLRTETAPLSALAVIQHAWGDL